MKKFDIVTFGGAVKDITFYTDQGKLFATPNNLTAQKMLAFEYGGKINAKEFYHNLGGGASNTGVSFSRLRLKTAVVVRLGKDEDGKEIIAKFKKEKIDTDFIQFDQKEHTGVSFILGVDKKDREHVAFLMRGANNNLTFPTNQENKLQAKWIYLSSLSGSGWQKTLKLLFTHAKNENQNIKIAWNPGILQLQAGKKVIGRYLKQTDVLIVNKDEAIELVLSGVKIGRRNPNYLNKPLYLLNILSEWGPKVVIITDGEKGAWVFDGKKIYHQKVKKSKVLDTTGVGDAFASAFIAGLIYNRGNLDQALSWGMVNSASVCTQVGAQMGLLTLDEIKKKV
ncbi:MAG: carbohydrate kinase family protein [Candidatus Buchananbacteria bacterium]|nr:carbohydrate kinase family protein [Candidatus Buchananbacteria bacterium]